MTGNAASNRVHETHVTVEFVLAHPLWQNDGDDERIAVQHVRDLIGDLGDGDSFEILEVETT